MARTSAAPGSQTDSNKPGSARQARLRAWKRAQALQLPATDTSLTPFLTEGPELTAEDEVVLAGFELSLEDLLDRLDGGPGWL